MKLGHRKRWWLFPEFPVTNIVISDDRYYTVTLMPVGLQFYGWLRPPGNMCRPVSSFFLALGRRNALRDRRTYAKQTSYVYSKFFRTHVPHFQCQCLHYTGSTCL